MKKTLIIIVLIFALSTTGAVLASDISDAIFFGKVRATNNSTLAQNVSAVVTINSTAWIESNTMNSTATDIAILNNSGADTPFMPGYDDNVWAVWYNAIPENGNVDATLYTNSSNGSIRYFPGNGGMTTSDSASLELGDNFTVNMTGYFDTANGTDKYIIEKGSFSIYISDLVSGNITSEIVNLSSANWTNIGTAVDNWDAWLEQAYSSTSVTGIKMRMKNASSITLQINEIQIYNSTNSEWVTATAIANTGSWSDSANAIDGNTGTYAYHAYAGSGVYTSYLSVGFQRSFVSTKMRAWVSYSAGSPNVFTRDTDYTSNTTAVSAIGIQSTDEILINLASGNFSISIDGDMKDSIDIGAISVPDNSNDYISLQNNSMPYMESYQITIGGTLQQSITWEYGTTFTDLSDNGHDATPTFRSVSSDDDVTVELINFAPISLAQVSDEDATGWGEIIVDPPDEPETAYTEEARPGFFFEPFIHSIWNLSGLPDSFFWYNFAFIFIIFGGMITYYLFAESKASALLIKCVAMAGIMIFFALPGLNIYGFFVPVYFMFYSFGILVLSRSFGW